MNPKQTRRQVHRKDRLMVIMVMMVVDVVYFTVVAFWCENWEDNCWGILYEVNVQSYTRNTHGTLSLCLSLHCWNKLRKPWQSFNGLSQSNRFSALTMDPGTKPDSSCLIVSNLYVCVCVHVRVCACVCVCCWKSLILIIRTDRPVTLSFWNKHFRTCVDEYQPRFTAQVFLLF